MPYTVNDEMLFTHVVGQNGTQKKLVPGTFSSLNAFTSMAFYNLTPETNYTIYLVGSGENPNIYIAKWTKVIEVSIRTARMPVVVTLGSLEKLGIIGLVMFMLGLLFV